MVRTRITQGSPLFRILLAVMRPFTLSPEDGARTAVFLATAPEVATVTGAYFEKQRAVPLKPHARDAVTARRLWDVSAALTAPSAAVAEAA